MSFMTTTPTSETTPYFDAPIIHFHMSQSSPPPKTATHIPPVEPFNAPTDVKEKHSQGVQVGPKDILATGATKETSSDNNAQEPSPSCPPIGSPSSQSMFTNANGQPMDGSTFIRGAATTGPNSTAEASDQLHLRAASADASLTPKQRSKITKAEAKDSKRLSKVIKEEAKTEKKSLSVALSELAQLQKLQKQAVNDEQKAQSTRSKALSQFQKEERAFLASRTKYEAAEARLQAEENALERVRSSARDVTARLQEKSQEVDSLRTTFAVDERERATKLTELADHSSKCF